MKILLLILTVFLVACGERALRNDAVEDYRFAEMLCADWGPTPECQALDSSDSRTVEAVLFTLD